MSSDELEHLDNGVPDAPRPGGASVGYDFTPHSATPYGDLVFYLSTNLVQTIDGPSKNTASLTPGLRTRFGANWYMLVGVEVPVTHEKAFD